MNKLSNININSVKPLVSPNDLKAALPVNAGVAEHITSSRREIKDILSKKDNRFVVIVGPCSIHDSKAAIEYAEKLASIASKVKDKIFVVMRVYFEKPRTTIGWKGLINDPRLNGSYDLKEGLHQARELLIKVNELGLPCGTEFLDPITPQYIDDLVTWAAIGARTTESQTHRQMASGLSVPVGYKNGTDGSLQIAIDAMESAKHPHHFLGMDQEGRSCVIETKGNPSGHIVLRGGNSRPNYDPESVKQAIECLKEQGLETVLVMDCSHANSGKKHERQEVVLNNVIEQRILGTKELIGIMVESNLYEGSQKIPSDLNDLKYGVSITDECISFETTERLIQYAYERLS